MMKIEKRHRVLVTRFLYEQRMNVIMVPMRPGHLGLYPGIFV